MLWRNKEIPRWHRLPAGPAPQSTFTNMYGPQFRVRPKRGTVKGTPPGPAHRLGRAIRSQHQITDFERLDCNLSCRCRNLCARDKTGRNRIAVVKIKKPVIVPKPKIPLLGLAQVIQIRGRRGQAAVEIIEQKRARAIQLLEDDILVPRAQSLVRPRAR